MSLVVSNLSKIYGEQKAVNQINFEVKKGEILGFLGPNGAGKSTTMKISTGYLAATSGNVKVCGIDVEKDPIHAKKMIGYLPEHNALYLEMYVHEYLRFAANVCGVAKAGQKTKEMIERVGLGREQNKKIGALSKGYRQRVGLAKAMIHDPQVLILDEPTTGLDPNQIVEIREVIKDLGREKTIVFSTHIMQEVQALCDRVVIINLGEIVADSDISLLKRSAESLVLELEFENDFTELTAFSKLENVLTFQKVAEKIIKLEISKDIRGDIFRFCAAKDAALVGMKLQEQTLENIFQELTKTKGIGA